jgi:hypothetical protein
MLHREKVVAAVEKLAPKLFQTDTSALLFLKDAWTRFSSLLDNFTVEEKLKNEFSLLLPKYTDEKLSLFYPVESSKKNYICASVDGSQIYPSRHEGISIALLNIGTVTLEYQSEQGVVSLESTPHIQQELDTTEYMVEIQTLVDAERLNLELQQLMRVGHLLKKRKIPFLLLMDGSFIFWNLVAQPRPFTEHYFSQYIDTLTDSVTEQLPFLCYTSKSHSRDCVRSLLAFLKHTEYQCIEEQFDEYKKITDATLLATILPPWHRTAFLLHRSQFTEQYPSELAVHFTYLATEDEIVRIELPRWMVKNKELSTSVLEFLVHQIKNGFGYPTTIALAHEQAVIKTPDRMFFANLLQQYAIQYNGNIRSHNSQKELRKKLADAITREIF